MMVFLITQVEMMNQENDEGAWLVTFPYKVSKITGGGADLRTPHHTMPNSCQALTADPLPVCLVNQGGVHDRADGRHHVHAAGVRPRDSHLVQRELRA